MRPHQEQKRRQIALHVGQPNIGNKMNSEISKRKALEYCCQMMRNQVEHQCDQHPNPFACPDNLIYYAPKFDEYGIIVHDGGSSFISIEFCPWCGKKLPESKRDRWFEKLEGLGFDDPFSQSIPEEYQSNAWYVK